MADIQKIKELIERNMSIREIGREIGLSFTATKYHINKNGLKTKPKYFIVPDDKTKVCRMCNVEKEVGEFIKRSNRRNTVHSYCKECVNKIGIDQDRKLKKKLLEYKGGECKNCGYKKYDGALDFHHVDVNTKDFSIAVNRGKSIARLKEEVDKCIILCSNCHRIEHQRIRDETKKEYSLLYNKDMKRKFVEYAGGPVCAECKIEYKDLCALDFHHLNPEEKKFNLSRAMNGINITDRIAQEIDKCILICSNCHREKHANKKEDSK
jgi:hypothetical protein